MEDKVRFDEEEDLKSATDPFAKKRQSFLVGWIMSMGLAKDEQQANVILLVFALIIFGFALYIAFF